MSWGYFEGRDFNGAARRLKAWIAGAGATAEYTPAVKADLQVGGVDAAEDNAVPIAEAAGAAITGAALPTGGVGLTGWLSAIWSRLGGSLTTVGAASEAHLGEVGGRIIRAAPAALPATSTAAYASGDALGSKMQLVGALRVAGGSGYLQDLTVALKTAGLTAALDAILFRADPAASTVTDNAAAVVAAADLDKVIGVVSFTRISNLGGGTLYEANQLARSIKLSAGQDIWLALVWRAAPTLGTTTNLAAVSANIAVD